MQENQTWLDPLDQIKGIGPKTQALFHKLGIETVKDLMFHFPFRFEDLQAREIDGLQDQEKVALVGTVVTPPVVNYYGAKKSRLSFKLAVDSFHTIAVTFFNQPYLKNQIELGQVRAIYGKYQEKGQALLGMKLINQTAGQDYAPIYPTTKGLKQATIVKAIRQVFESYQHAIKEDLPDYLNDHFNLMPIDQALKNLHFPSDDHALQQAKRKIIFQEFFIYQWRLQQAQVQYRSQPGMRVAYEVADLRQAIQQIPFELTGAQKKAVNEICQDLLADYPMKRLLQGDVGSGKTLVAFITMIATALAGCQAVLMAPTEILAHQHFASFIRYFDDLDLNVACLTADTSSQDRAKILQELANGDLQLVMGTHALIQEGVSFKRLAYVVIDEQHRFGVGQRQMLLDKGDPDRLPNLLQMTATPIPRSLAQTLYADIQVSTLDERPGNRPPVLTVALRPQAINQVYLKMEEELAAGHQVYYVLPLIEASEALDQVDNVIDIANQLASRFPWAEVGLLHGQMTKEDQNQVMTAFKNNQVHILVATTMVEVGVDVANATVMVIQGADRFGLSQLHQLRGRVGRSDLASYCYLIADPKTDQAKERLHQMTQTQDGFQLAQEDLKIRGMGDMMGRKQSGLPDFQYGNPITDQVIMTAAYESVHHLLAQPYRISESEWAHLQAIAQDQRMEI